MAVEATDPIERIYERRAATFDRGAVRLAAFGNRLSHARLAVFLLAAAGLAAGTFGSVFRGPFLVGGACLIAGFAFLVARHRAVLASADRLRSLGVINQHALARVRRQWDRLPPSAIAAEAGDPAFARDLDLFGRSSLAQLLNGGGATALGRRMLRGWLLEPATPETIAARQRAVAELAGQLNRRQRFAELGQRIGSDPRPTEKFLSWAEDRPWLAQRPWLRWTARLSPVALMLSAIAQLAEWMPLAIWGCVLLINVGLSLLFARTVHEIFNRVSSRAGEIAAYASLFELVGSRDSQAERLRQLQAIATDSTEGAIAHLASLTRLMSLADLRFSNLVHSVVQAVTLWDFHVLDAIERWQIRWGRLARQWFAALAEWDSLAALASLAHDNPSWVLPAVSPRTEPVILTATGLGHPLLPSVGRVVNDISLGPPGTFLLVTGSNMSGKSTLLRAIGLNVVLAQAGSVVAARTFRLPPLLVATSMRVEDSLADGTSLFMAELKRLKQIVDAAQHQREAGHPRRLLYLLDEILHGTNSVERQIAVRRVMLHLLQEGAIGAISTHDLALANVAPLDSAANAVHFQESFTEGPSGRGMTFDYKLREGLAVTTNALQLLDIVGLGPPDEPATLKRSEG